MVVDVFELLLGGQIAVYQVGVEATEAKHENAKLFKKSQKKIRGRTYEDCYESSDHGHPVFREDFEENVSTTCVRVLRFVLDFSIVNDHIGNAHCCKQDDGQSQMHHEVVKQAAKEVKVSVNSFFVLTYSFVCRHRCPAKCSDGRISSHSCCTHCSVSIELV